MNDITQKYDSEFFEYTISSELASSSDVASIIIKYYNPQSVIDIGCGCGIYLKAFKDLGVEEVIGYDGSMHAIDKALLPDNIILCDLRNPVIFNRKYDLCLCIEVAEHIEHEYSEQLVDTLAKASDIVFFTAAPPGQGGLHHVNEQPREFWTGLFNNSGFYVDDSTETIRSILIKKGVVYWITNNMIIYRKKHA